MLTELLAEPEMKSLTPVVVNYDTDAEFKTTFNTPNRSTILLFRGGKEIGRVVGVTDKDALRKLLATGATS